MKVSLLNQKHPTYDADELAQHGALYEGGKAWHALVDAWIPQNTAEPDALWTERKARACYDNHAGPILDLLGAFLFSEPATIDGLPAARSAWSGNVDLRSTDWSAWWAATFVRALVSRAAYGWINLPARPMDVPVTSAADEERLGLTVPFLVRIDASQVYDWGEDTTGALAWLVFHDVVEERIDVEAERVVKHRWTYIDAGRIRRWTWTATKDRGTPQDTDEASEDPEIAHNLGRLPVFRLQLPHGLWAMNKLADPVIGYTRSANSLDWSLHRAAHSLMTIASANPLAIPTLGPGYAILLTRDADGVDEVGYAEPSGSSFAAQAERVKSRLEEVYRVVQAMALGASSNATASALSGASKAMDWHAMTVMLASYAEVVKTAMRQSLAILEKPFGVGKDALTVSGLEGWQQEDIAQLLEDLTTAQPLIKSPTFRKLVAKSLATRLIPDTEPKALAAVHAEIDAADYEDAPVYTPTQDRVPKDDDREGAK